eukprot:1262418-Prymnesium_polylepis.3
MCAAPAKDHGSPIWRREVKPCWQAFQHPRNDEVQARTDEPGIVALKSMIRTALEPSRLRPASLK